MLRYFVALAAGFTAVATFGLGLGQGAEKQAAESPAKNFAATQSAANTDQADFILPPGFKPKKRGKYLLYCKTDTPIGSRFKKETCFDETQMRDYIVWMQENKRDIDRIPATCANVCACGQPQAC